VSLAHTSIAAPIDGIVIQRSVDVGQTVAASLQSPTIFVIAADLSKMQVSASIDESDIGKIQPGQRVSFSVDAYPDESFTGTTTQVRLQPVVVQNVTTYSVIIDVPNPSLKLKPGMTASVAIEIQRCDDAVRVPNAALRFRPTAETFADFEQPAPSAIPRAGTVVWTIDGGVLRAVPVQLGISDGQTTELIAGELQTSTNVVTNIGTSTQATRTAPTGGLFMPPGTGFGGGQSGYRR
jgi:HlyD family secretion protein